MRMFTLDQSLQHQQFIPNYYKGQNYYKETMLQDNQQISSENINQYFSLVRLNKQSAQVIHQTLEQLIQLINKTLKLRDIFFFNESGNEILYRLNIQYDLQNSLTNYWRDIKQLLNPNSISQKFKEYVERLSDVKLYAIKLSQQYMDIADKEASELDEIDIRNKSYTYYHFQISIQAAKELVDFLTSQRKIKVKYDETNAVISHFSKQFNKNFCDITDKNLCDITDENVKQKNLVKKWQILQQKLDRIKQKFKDRKKKKVSPNEIHTFIILLIVMFLLSLPIFAFFLATYDRYSELTEHWRLWTSSGSYLVYRWASAAIYQYSLSNRLDPNISFMCNSEKQACFKSSKFIWCTLLVETTLFLWLFMVYLFFQPAQFLPMVANCLAVLCFCFEVAYGIYHIEIIEVLMFKCSFYEFAAVFPIVSEVVFNTGFFLLFEAECSPNNAFQKLVYLVGTVSIVLIRLSYFYHRVENGQNLSKLKEKIQQRQKQQRQLKNRIKELEQLRLIQNRNNYRELIQFNNQDSLHEIEIHRISLDQLQAKSSQLQIVSSNIAHLQKNLCELCSQLKQQQKFGILFFFIVLTQIGFLFKQSTAILVIDIILISMSLIFLGRNRILFMLDLLKIRFVILGKFNFNINNYLLDKSTFKLCMESIGLIVCLLSNISFAFGVHNCYFQSLHWWKKHILQAINILIYFIQSILIIHSARDSIRYPLSGLINLGMLDKLVQNPSKLTNGIEIMREELQKRNFNVSFQENRRNIIDLQSLIPVFRENKRKIKLINDKLQDDFRSLGFQP